VVHQTYYFITKKKNEKRISQTQIIHFSNILLNSEKKLHNIVKKSFLDLKMTLIPCYGVNFDHNSTP